MSNVRCALTARCCWYGLGAGRPLGTRSGSAAVGAAEEGVAGGRGPGGVGGCAPINVAANALLARSGEDGGFGGSPPPKVLRGSWPPALLSDARNADKGTDCGRTSVLGAGSPGSGLLLVSLGGRGSDIVMPAA